MSYDGIEVNYSSLQEVEDNLIAAAKAIVGRLDQLENSLRDLNSDKYEGVGKQEFRQSKDQWDKAMDDMILLIQGVAANTGEAQSAYRQADKRAGDRMSQIRA